MITGISIQKKQPWVFRGISHGTGGLKTSSCVARTWQTSLVIDVGSERWMSLRGIITCYEHLYYLAISISNILVIHILSYYPLYTLYHHWILSNILVIHGDYRMVRGNREIPRSDETPRRNHAGWRWNQPHLDTKKKKGNKIEQTIEIPSGNLTAAIEIDHL